MSVLVLFSISVADQCIDCHTEIQPNIVKAWQISKHSQNEVSCATCHGDSYKTKEDFSYAKIPTPELCAKCHETQVEQFSKGKHALAWAAMNAIPTIHHQTTGLIAGMKGCGGCHKIGLKSEDIRSKRMQ